MLQVLFVLFCLTVAISAVPTSLESRGEVKLSLIYEKLLKNDSDVSAEVLGQFNLWEQYSAAAYCLPNNDSPGDKVACVKGQNCPLVEAATTITSIEFQK
jgi:Lipase 3 N-terminal region